MKTKVLLITAIAVLNITHTAFAQVTKRTSAIVDDIHKASFKKIANYCNEVTGTKSYKAADSMAFNNQFREIFSTVIINNTDVVNNGSAFSYSQDKDKHTFSANMSFAGKEWNNFLLDVGTNITNVNDNYTYYSDNAWASQIGVRVGLNYAFLKWQSAYPENCEKTKNARTLAIGDKIAALYEAVNYGKGIDALEEEKLKYNDSLFDGIKTNSKKIKLYKEKLEKLHSYIKTLKELDKAFGDDKMPVARHHYGLHAIMKDNNKYREKLERYTAKMFTEFDEKNNDFHGYGVLWVNANVNISNNDISFKNDSIINEDIQRKYSNMMKASFEVSGNLNSNTENYLHFAKLYGRLNYGSYLDSPTLLGQNVLLAENVTNPEAPFYEVVTDNGLIVGNYDRLRNPLYHMDFGGYYAVLCLFNKTLGFNGRFNFNFPPGKGIEAEYKQSYSAMAGFIFRVAKADKWNVATFTINGGVENTLHTVNAWDNFIVKASIGVPFSIFEPKKKIEN